MSFGDERSRTGGIDEVPVPGPGRVWLCGKHFIGPDPEVALERTGAAVVVCLNERGELEDRYPEYVEQCPVGGHSGQAKHLRHKHIQPQCGNVAHRVAQ